MLSRMTEYPEVAREEMAGYGSQDALGDGQHEQEQESRLCVCVQKSTHAPDEPKKMSDYVLDNPIQ